jgi:multiple sugar transport system permease protein
VAWLSNPKTAFNAVSVAELWRGIPFFAISLLAALQGIPLELYESCEIDGGGRLRKFFSITLSYLKETIILTTLLRTIWEFNAVDLIMVATGGGPVARTTNLSIFLADLAIKNRNFGYGSSIGVVSFCIMFIFAAVYLKAGKFTGREQ